MLHGRTTQGLRLITAFEGRDHTPPGVVFGEFHDFPRYPVIITVQQVELTHIIVEVGIETGRHQYQLRSEQVQGR